jgi:uncharacterized protein (DUF433 family)
LAPAGATVLADDDFRLSVPLFTVGEAARYLGVAPSTLGRWSRRELLISREGDRGRGASVPFIGLAEGLVVAAFRATKIPMQRIIPALEKLKGEVGVEHALASQSLYSDGAEILYDYSEHCDHKLEGLTVVRSNQRVFADVVRDYLDLITYDFAGWPSVLRLPRFERVAVVVDPHRAFGQPILHDYGVRVEDLVERWHAGEPAQSIATDFRVPPDLLEDVLRAA